MDHQEAQTLYSTAALARLYGVSYETIRLWRKAGKIRPSLMTPGGRPRWTFPPLGTQGEA
jgi:predicted site-specific integrase-resolvase